MWKKPVRFIPIILPIYPTNIQTANGSQHCPTGTAFYKTLLEKVDESVLLAGFIGHEVRYLAKLESVLPWSPERKCPFIRWCKESCIWLRYRTSICTVI
jgi:hypothetical protein